MGKSFSNVYQFKITLRDVKPPIWRRIQVPETFTFKQLHDAIQSSMGWGGHHLHSFEMYGTEIGEGGLPEGKTYISDFFSMRDKKGVYLYDFGDNWEHGIVLEKILPKSGATKYPTCLDGKRACPPDDCGGSWGYMELLNALSDTEHPEHEDMTEWIGEDFDPEYFDAKNVRFHE
ncbi:MAG: plasmid pRiA4b ORF-3 family protein [Nitrospirae bacterium]|nr:plasmid pRiA4b ORF-3 family protein [Nitrospirota bacterium]